MVVKTEVCAFSGHKVFPGHGRRYIRMDSRIFLFIARKENRYFQMKRNPRKLPWTQWYRKMHKKGTSAEEVSKRRNRKATTSAVTRGIVGATPEMILAKKNETTDRRAAARETLIRAVKERKRKDADAKAAKAKTASKDKKKAAPKPAAAAGAAKQKVVPKNTKAAPAKSGNAGPTSGKR